jgi:hypothetical protein
MGNASGTLSRQIIDYPEALLVAPREFVVGTTPTALPYPS